MSCSTHGYHWAISATCTLASKQVARLLGKHIVTMLSITLQYLGQIQQVPAHLSYTMGRKYSYGKHTCLYNRTAQHPAARAEQTVGALLVGTMPRHAQHPAARTEQSVCALLVGTIHYQNKYSASHTVRTLPYSSTEYTHTANSSRSVK